MPRSKLDGSTHADGCWSWGPAHYECAKKHIEELHSVLLMWYAARGERDQHHAMQRTAPLISEITRARRP